MNMSLIFFYKHTYRKALDIVKHTHEHRQIQQNKWDKYLLQKRDNVITSLSESEKRQLQITEGVTEKNCDFDGMSMVLCALSDLNT